MGKSLDSNDCIVSQSAELDDTMHSVVDTKHMGTTTDQQDMLMLGRVQELRRNFKYISVLAFGCTLIGTWEFFLGLIQFGLMDGGTAGLIYGYIICFAGFVCVYLSIAEMASMAPTSGGQYHWVSEFAPASAQKYLSYLSGWLVFTGWQFSIVATAFLAGTITQGLIVLNDAYYDYQRWHGTMLVIAVMVFSVVFNIFLAKRLPFIETILLMIYFIGFFAIVIPLWVLAPRASSHAVFTEFNDSGGWATIGTAVMVGMSTTISSLTGFDCAVHMAEEIHDASRTLPRAVVSGVLVNGFMGLAMVITLCYTLGSVSEVLATPTKYPFIQVFFNTTGSYPATNVMTSIVIIVFVSSVISTIATSSRQLWSFARDGGVPFASFIAKVHKGQSIPLNAIVVSLILVILTSFINIGSTVALNAITAISLSAQLSSYILTIACLLLKRVRGQPIPVGRWSLGRFGLILNAAALIYLLPMFIFIFFPLATPVVPSSMNWGIAVYGAVVLLSTAYYLLGGRAKYTPPVLLVHRSDDYYDAKL